MKFAKQRRITLNRTMCSVSTVSVKKTPTHRSRFIGSMKDKNKTVSISQTVRTEF